MTEPFNPNAFRQQMAQNQTGGIPTHPSPQVPVAPQIPPAVAMPKPGQPYPMDAVSYTHLTLPTIYSV